jgi:hypothetical protein
VSQTSGWRQRLARRLDPSIGMAPEPVAIESAPPAQDDHGELWAAICDQFALRILAAAYQMGGHLEAAEADEQDPDRLEKLYRIDHANTRVRRQAENLQVLAGRKVDDASRQVTPLVDVIRASASAIEYYARVHIGWLADLAVVEYAADDVIRIVTELLDNATRFSPPTSTVIVSAHITERGSVLLRIEDAGVGIRHEQLPVLNAMLAGDTPPPLDGDPAARLGLVVVQRLALANRIRVHLTARQPSGTTATVLIPEGLLCEIPLTPGGTGLISVADRYHSPTPTQRQPNSVYRGSAMVPPAHLVLVDQASSPAQSGFDTGAAIDSQLGETRHGLPRRVPGSLRGEPVPTSEPASESPEITPLKPVADQQLWPDETADFAAGISDAQWPAGDTPWAGGDPPWTTDPSSEGHL